MLKMTVLSYRDELPPVVRILLDEDIHLGRLKDQLNKLRRLFPELRRQAEWTRKNFTPLDEEFLSGQFAITASGKLDPFLGGHCLPDCQIESANQFAQTLGLFADVVTISDPFTVRLFRARQRPPRSFFLNLLVDCLILKEIEPLIRAGVVRFRSLSYEHCSDCHSDFLMEIDKASEDLIDIVNSELTFRVKNDLLTIGMGSLTDPPRLLDYWLSDELKRDMKTGLMSVRDVGRSVFTKHIKEELHRLCIEAQSAASMSSPLFSSSRLDVLALRALEGQSPDLKEIELWEGARSIKLPWIKQLTPEGVVQLREEAAYALPQFRERMLKVLSERDDEPKAVTSSIMELREEAEELVAKLKSLRLDDGKRGRSAFGSLAITLSIYGFAAGFPAWTQIAMLMSALLGLHLDARKDAKDAQELISRPAYVLVKAKELIS